MLMSDQHNTGTTAPQQQQKQEQSTTSFQSNGQSTVLPLPQQPSMTPAALNATTTTSVAIVLNAESQPVHSYQSLYPGLNTAATDASASTRAASTATSTTATATASLLAADPMAAPEARISTKKLVEVVSHATVDALGEYLDSATNVRSFSAIQEQRRKDNYKSSQLVNKTMRQSQQERRRQALLEQTKRRHQLVNHARRLALFSSEGGGDSTSGDEDSEQDEADEDDDDEEETQGDDEDEHQDEEESEEEDNVDGGSTTAKKRKKKKKRRGSSGQLNSTAGNGDGLLVIRKDSASMIKQKRRLSSGSESESGTNTRRGERRNSDILSPKKPRLQRLSPKPKKKAPKNPFKDQLMIPEPLTEIPEDLDANYYIIPIPTGHRCFLISSDGRTTARLPSGQLLVSAFESCLPAGAHNYKGNRKTDYCILDCVYSPQTRTFWTLDIMCWRGHPVYECETEFRFWWLRGKLAEIEALQQKWIQTQTREFEAEETKRRQKWIKRQERNARRLRAKQDQERLQQQQGTAAPAMEGITDTTASVSSSSDSHPGKSIAPTTTLAAKSSVMDVAMDDDDGESLSDTGMELEDLSSLAGPTKEYIRREFWPISFTPLPYFNASMDLVRLLAESMYAPPNTVQPAQSSAPGLTSPSFTTMPSATVTTATVNTSGSSTVVPSSHAYLGTMALSGEIAEAAALFPAHDLDQRRRQDRTLQAERAAGLAFYNKKTMYVLGMTPLCGWVAMDRIGDIFFGEEGGVGPVPGTRAVEGREIEMEGALERITLSV